jgi:hypothetical protein
MVQLADNLWWVEGDLPDMGLRRTMVVARLASGDLVIHSCIALGEAAMAELEALGRPAWLVVPNGWHRMDAARYKARYPELKVICPPGARKRVSKVVGVHATYDELAQPDEQDDSVRLEPIDGGGGQEGVMVVRSSDGISLVVADTIFNLPHGKGLFWFIYGRVLGSTGGPRVTVIGRFFLLKRKAQFKAWLQRMAAMEGLVRHPPPVRPCHAAGSRSWPWHAGRIRRSGAET